MKVKYIKNRIGRVGVVSIGYNLLVRVGDKIYLFQNPDNPAPHRVVQSFDLPIKEGSPMTVEGIFEIIDKQNALQDD